jgi:hypothetical protein
VAHRTFYAESLQLRVSGENSLHIEQVLFTAQWYTGTFDGDFLELVSLEKFRPSPPSHLMAHWTSDRGQQLPTKSEWVPALACSQSDGAPDQYCSQSGAPPD